MSLSELLGRQVVQAGMRPHSIDVAAPPLEDRFRLAAHAALLNGERVQLIRECPQQRLRGDNRYKVPGGAEAPPA